MLLLPNGLVIKPSAQGNGDRWVIGQFHGPVILDRPDGGTFNLAAPGPLQPGARWNGPATTGLSCVIDAGTGTLRAESRVPTAYGFLRTTFDVWGPDPMLALEFFLARPSDRSGRVRVTANGHVITTRQGADEWESVYVGQIDVTKWPHRAEWVEGVTLETPHRFDSERVRRAIQEIRRLDHRLTAHEEEAESNHGRSREQNTSPVQPPRSSAPSAPPASAPPASAPPASAPPASASPPPRRSFWNWLGNIAKGN